MKGNISPRMKEKKSMNVQISTTINEAFPSGASASTLILQMRGISKSFGAVRALSNVDFEVYSGEVVALVGDNGAGKSTLVKAISGVEPADEGDILLDGVPVKITNPQMANRLGIETIYQDLALCDNLDVVANQFLGREELAGGVILSEIGMEQKTLAVLRTLEITIPSVREHVATLSGGQRQSIAVAKAVLRHARIVLLDEPTSGLGIVQARQVLTLIRHLRDQGLGVVLISHKLSEVFEVADRIVVLRLGSRVATFATKQTTSQEVVATITGAAFGHLMDGKDMARQ